MIKIKQDNYSIVYFSLRERISSTSNYYLMNFISDFSKETTTCILSDTTFLDRGLLRVKIRDVKITGVTPNLNDAEVDLSPPGYWRYEIYEQTNNYNLDITDSVVVQKLEEGKLKVIGINEEVTYTEHTDTTNTTNFIHIP